jgi:hypothetical protein
MPFSVFEVVEEVTPLKYCWDVAVAKFRMSSATNPRKSAPLSGSAPWPRIGRIGPWLVRSLSGVEELNAAPALGSTRLLASVSVPRHAVLAVEKKSVNFVKSSTHGDTPLLLPGACV